MRSSRVVGLVLLVLVLAASAVGADAPYIVLDRSGQPSREIILVDGQRSYRVATIPVDGAAPTPGPTPPTPGPNPPPTPPTPTPDPAPPAPFPVVGKVWASYVVPADAPTPEAAAIRDDPAIRAMATKTDVVWRTFVAGEEELAKRKLDGYVKQYGAGPVLIFQTSDGVVLPNPINVRTRDEVLEAMRRLRGVP